MSIRRIQAVSVHILPALYFCAILTSIFGYEGPAWLQSDFVSAVLSILYFPIGIASVVLVWGHSTLAVLWTLLGGTAWTYVLVLATRYLFRRVTNSFRDPKAPSITSGK